jgi:hypothetical protein
MSQEKMVMLVELLADAARLVAEMHEIGSDGIAVTVHADEGSILTAKEQLKALSTERNTNLRESAKTEETLNRAALQSEMADTARADKLAGDLARARVTGEAAERSQLEKLRYDQASQTNKSLTAQTDTERKRASDDIKRRLQGEAADRKTALKTDESGYDFWGEIAAGDAPRRMFTKALSHAFGDSAVGSAAAAFGGMMAAGMVLPLVWKISDILANIPGIAMGNLEKRGRLLAGPLSREEAAGYDVLRRKGEYYWGASPGGDTGYVKGLEQFQNLGVKDVARVGRVMSWAMALSSSLDAGDRAELAGKYARIMRPGGGSVEDKLAILNSNFAIELALRENAGADSTLNRGTEDQKRHAMRIAIKQGWIGEEGLLSATERVARKFKGRVQSETDIPEVIPGTGLPDIGKAKAWRGLWSEISQMISDPPEWLTTGHGSHLLKEQPGFGGPDPTGEFSFGSQPAGVPTYQFTSATGLAEQMQIRASEQVDVHTGLLERIATAVEDKSGRPETFTEDENSGASW